MNEPSAENRIRQQQERIQQKINLIESAWERSERVLEILRYKEATCQPITPEQKLKWAQDLRII